jgi:hypothetical protein
MEQEVIFTLPKTELGGGSFQTVGVFLSITDRGGKRFD